jgi:uncharacterized protein (DUF1697 family)
MALVAFLRGVNVGGHRIFQPSALARELDHLGVVNVGAAGTFVIRGRCSQEDARAQIGQKMGFPAELMICRGGDLIDVVGRDPFSSPPCTGDLRRFASVLAQRPRKHPPLPLDVPANGAWQVRLIEISGPFVLGWWRRLGKRFIDPNGAVEKSLGVSATTRNWNTIVKLAEILERSRSTS